VELYVKTSQGLRPDFLDRLSGLSVEDETVWATALCLTEHDSQKVLPNSSLARVFARVMHKLAKGRAINFFFSSDLGEINRNFRDLGIKTNSRKKNLFVEVRAEDISLMERVLEAAAFTTFYGWIDGTEIMPEQTSFLFENLGTIELVAVFSLYDETVEIVSKLVPVDFVLQSVREVALEAGIEVSS
jgi:hypothetical protein